MSATAAAHNPDILTCLANLSADEVFTPPNLAVAMLDMLPQDLFRSDETTGGRPFRRGREARAELECFGRDWSPILLMLSPPSG